MDKKKDFTGEAPAFDYGWNTTSPKAEVKYATKEEIVEAASKYANRFNSGKPQWSIVDFKSLEPMVRVLEFGAKKYSRDNWKKGMPINEICDSLMRHLVSYMGGEELDPESGLHHIGHIQCNAMFLSYMINNNSIFEDKLEDNE